MIFLVNRANLDRRTLYRRIHDSLASRAKKSSSPVESVRYYPSKANMEEVHARIDAPAFVGSYPVDSAEIHVYFDFPQGDSPDSYRIQWVESRRGLMVGWHQDETHPELGECHLQIDYEGETVHRSGSGYIDAHPLNVFDERMNAVPSVLDRISWDGESGEPRIRDGD